MMIATIFDSHRTLSQVLLLIAAIVFVLEWLNVTLTRINVRVSLRDIGFALIAVALMVI